jgi:3-hydroxyisobutyrate dehydrogenase
MRIGSIGLGPMGRPAALKLIRGGYQLAVCDLEATRAAEHCPSSDKLEHVNL